MDTTAIQTIYCLPSPFIFLSDKRSCVFSKYCTMVDENSEKKRKFCSQTRKLHEERQVNDDFLNNFFHVSRLPLCRLAPPQNTQATTLTRRLSVKSKPLPAGGKRVRNWWTAGTRYRYFCGPCRVMRSKLFTNIPKKSSRRRRNCVSRCDWEYMYTRFRSWNMATTLWKVRFEETDVL
jgi:hypothetical protein